MLQTELTKKIGIKYPIVGGTMMSVSTAEFTGAMANAGGLGILASANYGNQEEFAKAIDQVQAITNNPFAVNLNLFPAVSHVDNNAYLDILAEKDVKIVETSGHSAPADLCERIKSAGMTWIHKCVGIKYAKKVESMGADFITVVGHENGGALGKFDISTLVLVPAVKDAISLPLIGGGGVSDGRGLAAILALGAAGVIIGTRLLLTKECPIHDNLKQALLNASETDTMLIMRSIGAAHRVWANAAAKRCEEIESTGGDLAEVLSVVAGEKARKMYYEGDLDAGVVSTGQGVGLIHDIPSVKELFDRMAEEAGNVIGGLAEN